ncbi:DUF2231 domain-containing protein [Sinosporangium siamense]|uniref:DUF2231 domain-containing protein n=1 Tax=Sinosporangium siamense TaxID=1367973 RepID=A0A919VEN9_9ACTN|nr:DUF2231 domain-containing protein [Sinosporangium siamense]GII95314.1 hypothetical protein Ssi02_55450 [Sinosporangium siamense]
MFNEIFGLPLHPLVVHAAVVLAPLFALLALVLGLLPGQRDRLGWAITGLAVLAPLSVLGAQLTGPLLRDRVFGGQPPSGELGERIAMHEGFSLPLLLLTAGLSLASLLQVHGGARFGPGVTNPLRILTVVLALAVVYYTVRAGHSGAEAVWLTG